MKTNKGYSTPTFQSEIDLKLNANESCSAIPALNEFWAQMVPNAGRLYPSQSELQSAIGAWLKLDSDRIVITAGGDESIERLVRLYVGPQRNRIVTHAPTFEMVKIYADNHQGVIHNVDWLRGSFPVNSIREAIDDQTAIVVLTTPNNPTGQSIDSDTVLSLAQTAQDKGAIVLLDHAYVEFADGATDRNIYELPNVFVIRTFSKAWGLAGMRVGFAVAPDSEKAANIRNASGPYPVSGVSLATALESLTNYLPAMKSNINRIKSIRSLMFDLIQGCGGQAIPSTANFILAEFENAERIWSELAMRGIGIRKFVDRPVLANYLRITCPATEGDYHRLLTALCEIADVEPEPFRDQAALVLKSDLVVDDEVVTSRDELSTSRSHQLRRTTKETEIEISLNLDGTGDVDVETGIGFLNHMLTALAFHAGLDLKLKCVGDLDVDDHHTAEDCALALGTAIDQALGTRKGIKRFGYAFAPLDEALARTVVDLSGRPWPEVHLHLQRPMIGSWACENITHFFQSLAMSLKCSLHVDVLRGTNDHHRVEAAFKSLAKALKESLTQTEGDVPSTKGVL